MNLNRKFIYSFCALYLNWSIFVEILRDLSIILLGYEHEGIIFFNKIVSILYLLIIILLMLIRKKGTIAVIICQGWLCLCILTLILIPAFEIIFTKAVFYSFSQVIAVIYLLLEIDEMDELVKILEKYIFIGILYSVIHWRVFDITGQYSMAYSHSSMIPALLSFLLLFEKKKILYFVYSGFFLIVNIRCGSRGSLLCYGVAVIFYFLIFGQSGKKLFYIFSGIPVCFLFLLNMKKIFLFISKYMKGSRTIELFAEGKFFYLSSRDKYYHFVIEEVIKSPLRIRGIYSDRIYLGEFLGCTEVNSIFGTYSHNFILEILFQFGIWGGIILLLCAFFLQKSVHEVKTRNDSALKTIYIIFASYCIGQLLFSGSYLTAVSFGALAGVISSMNINKTYKCMKNTPKNEKKF